MKPTHLLWIFGLVLLAAVGWFMWNPPFVVGWHGTYPKWRATKVEPHSPKTLRPIPADAPFRIVMG